MTMDVYNAALSCARDKLTAYKSTPTLATLTPEQVTAVRVMIADAWICGYDAREALYYGETTPHLKHP